jgi:hypothetical protein
MFRDLRLICRDKPDEKGGGGGGGGDTPSYDDLVKQLNDSKAENLAVTRERDIYRSQSTSKPEPKEKTSPREKGVAAKAAADHAKKVKELHSEDDYDEKQTFDLIREQNRLDRAADAEKVREAKEKDAETAQEIEKQIKTEQLKRESTTMKKYFGFKGTPEAVDKLLSYQAMHNIDSPLEALLEMRKDKEKSDAEAKKLEEERKTREHKTVDDDNDKNKKKDEESSERVPRRRKVRDMRKNPDIRAGLKKILEDR